MSIKIKILKICMYKEYEAQNKNGTRPIAAASVGGVC